MTIIAEFWEQVTKTSDCWTWNRARTGPGYGHLHNESGTDEYAHRVAYRLAYGPIPDGMVVCHSCDNPPCVRPDHLFLGTQADNVHDRDSKGRGLLGKPRDPVTVLRGPDHPNWKGGQYAGRVRGKGTKQGTSKLTPDQVRSIRAAYAAGARQIDLAHEFAVDPRNIRFIVNGERWKDVQ